jgi:hypothetical protein
MPPDNLTFLAEVWDESQRLQAHLQSARRSFQNIKAQAEKGKNPDGLFFHALLNALALAGGWKSAPFLSTEENEKRKIAALAPGLARAGISFEVLKELAGKIQNLKDKEKITGLLEKASGLAPEESAQNRPDKTRAAYAAGLLLPVLERLADQSPEVAPLRRDDIKEHHRRLEEIVEARPGEALVPYVLRQWFETNKEVSRFYGPGAAIRHRLFYLPRLLAGLAVVGACQVLGIDLTGKKSAPPPALSSDSVPVSVEPGPAPDAEKPTMVSIARLRFLVEVFPVGSDLHMYLAVNLKRALSDLPGANDKTEVPFDVRLINKDESEKSGKETLQILLVEAVRMQVFPAAQPPAPPLDYRFVYPETGAYQVREPTENEKAAAAARRTAARALRRAGQADVPASG